jgi:hypothetical protein
VGARGHDGFAGLLLGSVSHYPTRDARVLLTPTRRTPAAASGRRSLQKMPFDPGATTPRRVILRAKGVSR